MPDSHTPHPPKRRARVYERLRQPGSSLVPSAGIGVAIRVIFTTLLAVLVAIIW
jgi:hypothetical protein